MNHLKMKLSAALCAAAAAAFPIHHFMGLGDEPHGAAETPPPQATAKAAKSINPRAALKDAFSTPPPEKAAAPLSTAFMSEDDLDDLEYDAMLAIAYSAIKQRLDNALAIGNFKTALKEQLLLPNDSYQTEALEDYINHNNLATSVAEAANELLDEGYHLQTDTLTSIWYIMLKNSGFDNHTMQTLDRKGIDDGTYESMLNEVIALGGEDGQYAQQWWEYGLENPDVISKQRDGFSVDESVTITIVHKLWLEKQVDIHTNPYFDSYAENEELLSGLLRRIDEILDTRPDHIQFPQP